MVRFFSLPIVFGVIGGIWFPYSSLSLIWTASILFVLLMVFNVLEVPSFRSLFSSPGWTGRSAVIFFLLFVFFPVVQTGIAAALITDRSHILGVAMASLAPPALVVPMLLRRNGHDPSLGCGLMIVGMLFYPLILLPMAYILKVDDTFLAPRTLLSNAVFLSVVPIFMGILLPRIFPRFRQLLLRKAPALNSFVLGGLMFILVGSAINQAPLRSWRGWESFTLFGLMVWMDIGIYFVMRWLWNEGAAIILSVRNFALPASLLLFFDGKAALAPAIGLAIHAVFFQWLMSKRVAKE